MAPMVRANGRPFIGPSREPGSFVLHIDSDTKRMLMETGPDTYWQTPHYDGWPGVLVRYAPPIRSGAAMIDRAAEWARSRKPPRPRTI